jgi:uncharacterized delta-60 repeat protein
MLEACHRRHRAWLLWLVVVPCLAFAATAQALTQDITAQFAITRTALFLNRVTNTYDSTTTLKNASTAPVLGPIDVIVSGLPGTVTLSNGTGQTRDGKPYLTPLAAGTLLQPGASVSFTLKFNNPQRTTFASILQVLSTVELAPGAPNLLAAIATGGTNAFLIGRIDGEGAANRSISLQALSSPTCVSGVLVNGVAAGAPVTATTDALGFFSASVSGVNPGAFVAVQTTTVPGSAPPASSPASACLVASRDNDSWPKAFTLDASPASVNDFIDAPGKARWYKFAISPGQRIEVRLSGLPADYDLAVFRDIGQVFAGQFEPKSAGSGDLLKLTAEYAPSIFSPSIFSPSIFSPSIFSPDAYSPSIFSPSIFSPSIFSPSIFSPSIFSPSIFSPSIFSPSIFSPSIFSPSIFSPSIFSPSIFSPTEIAQAFSTAQSRSIVAASITPGNGDELAVANTWNRTGYFYARVTGRGGAFNTSIPFSLSVTKGATTCVGVNDTAVTSRATAPASGLGTVIVTDSSKVALDAVLPGATAATLRDKLNAFAARSDVAGVLVDVSSDDRVKALRAQAAANPACPFAKNLVAEEIKGIVDSYRANPLRYVVIVGNDDAIPFFRSPDQSGLGQESDYVPPVQSNSPSESSLRLDFVLSQDRYGSKTTISLPWNDFPVPGLAVGRLVESAAEVASLLDAYAATNAVVSPTSTLVTGYDFLEDAAEAVKDELDAGTGTSGDALITPNGTSPQDQASWTATQLRAKLFDARHDVIFLAGHFSANSALAADFRTSVLTTDLAASTTDFTNSIVFSAGCHSGYNLVDGDAIPGVTLPLDWAQAFSRKKATLIAGTGYQYGDTDFLEYSERLYKNFAQQLRAGPAGYAVSVGEALVQAKLAYLGATPDIRGLHEKAVLEATLFGLPMLGVNMPSGRGAIPGTAPAISPTPVASGPAATLGLRTKDISVAAGLAPHTQALKNLRTGTDVSAAWLSGPDGVVSKPGEPALPLAVVNVTPTDPTLVLRGIGYRGGTYVDSTPLFPFSGAPTTETRGVHVPFLSPVHYPATMWTPNYFGALAGSGGTELLVTPVQHRAANVVDGTSTQRMHTDVDLRLFYSGNLSQAALSDAPTVVAVDAQANAAGVAFTAQVVGDPAAAIYQVWITYTGDGTGAWTSLDLEQCVRSAATNLLPASCGTTDDSRLWKGVLAGAPANLKYFVQAASGVGLVARSDNGGAYFAPAAPTPTATTMALISAPSTATIGDSISVTAKLSYAGGVAVAGKLVSVGVGGVAQFGTTASDGTATVKVPVVAAAGSYQISAAFAGDDIYQPSSVALPVTLVRATATPVPVAPGVASAGINITSALGGATTAPQQVPVAFTVTGQSGTTTIYAITDVFGNATLPPPSGLPAGTYTVTQATFGGNGTFAPTTIALSQTFVVPKISQSIAFDALANRFFGDPDFTVFASASSGLAVTYGASGACTIAGTTVHLTGTGSCTITADQAGDANTNAAAQVARTFSIVSTATVTSLVRSVPSPTMADSVTYTLTFSEAVTGVTAGNFAVAPTGITSASVAQVSGSGTTWTVTVNTGRGTGSLRLDMINGTGVTNGTGTPLAGTPFNGETYGIDKGGTLITPITQGDGLPVASFGLGGYAAFSDVQFPSSGGSIAVLADDRILVASGDGCAQLTPGDPQSPSYCTLQLGRYMPNGAPDASFGLNGRVTTAIASVLLETTGIVVNTDETLLVAGIQHVSGNDVPFVARFTSAGVLDVSFGDGGLTLLNALPIPAGAQINGFAVDASGRIVMVSTVHSATEGDDIVVARLTSAGVLDSTFGSAGVAQFAISTIGDRFDRGTTVAIQPDGKIVVGGRTRGAQGFDFLVMRLDANGVRDPAFGVNGVATARIAGTTSNDYGRKLVLRPDGKVTLVGSLVVGSVNQCGVARFNTDGSPDTTFGAGGQVFLTFPATSVGCFNVGQQPDGKVVIGGNATTADVNNVVFARLLDSGALDASFGVNGLMVITGFDGPSPIVATSGGNLLTMLSKQDPADGVTKSYVVELASTPAGPFISQTITFNAPPDASFGAQAFQPNAAASSGLPVSLVATGACASGGNLVQILGVGSCTITASQPGNATYLAAAPVSRTFSIAAANQMITFGNVPAVVTTADPLIVVAATSTSTTAPPSVNPIVFSSLVPSVCTVSGINTTAFIQPLAAGTCTIVASQTGTANYGDANQVSLSFTIGSPTTTPQVFTVMNLNDSGTGSLRSAISQANAHAGPDFVDFAPGLTGTIVLTSGQIQISGPVTITGPDPGSGPPLITIDGNANSRIFSIFATDPACPAIDGPDYLVTISNLRLYNAHRNVVGSNGGAIFTEHSMLLDTVVFDSNVARGGAGIYFQAQYAGQSLTVSNSQFLNNIATELLPATGDTFPVSGGGVYVVQRCANAQDVPYTEPVSATIIGSEFRGNRVRPLTTHDGDGAAIRSWSRADIAIFDTRIVDNRVEAPNPPIAGFVYRGGAFQGLSKSLLIEQSEISDNAVFDATDADVTRGGGLHVGNPAIDRQDPGNAMRVRIINSTISGNTVSATAGAMLVSGNVALELDNATVASNSAAPTRTGGIALSLGATYPVSGNDTARPTLALVSSIVANNSSTGGDLAALTNLFGTLIVSANNSLVQKLCPVESCTFSFSGAGSLFGQDPLLGALGDNGGLSRTHALQPGSPAINAGSNPFGLTTDQRGTGFPRVSGVSTDMGAYESP